MNMDLKGITTFLSIIPTEEQVKALQGLEKFISSTDDVFVLKGAAGTGKTTIIKALADFLTENEVKFKLCAPTGKAAKVISNKTNYLAGTIHSEVFTPEPMLNGISVKLTPKTNKGKDFCIYIIDEASMIGDKLCSNEDFITTQPLLKSIIKYVKEGNSKNKIVFIGDSFQLGPIESENFSPALDVDYLKTKYNLNCAHGSLTEVKRQGEGSYILKNAEILRGYIQNEKHFNGLQVPKMSFSEQIRKYHSLMDSSNLGNVISLSFTNGDAKYFNDAIRQKLYGYKKRILEIGDIVVLDKNWYGANGQVIPNGEVGIIKAIDLLGIKQCGGVSFADAEIQFFDTSYKPYRVNALVMLDTIIEEKGKLCPHKAAAMYAEVMKKNPVFRESKMPWNDKFIGAMRLRYGYGMTCHKSQGSEWNHVMLHNYFKPNDNRWLYTAVTRAKKELYLRA